MIKGTYSDLRSSIRMGDTVCIETGTLGGRIIHLAQWIAGVPRPHLTHTAIALWIDGVLYALEMNAGGNVLKRLSQYAGKRMVVCAGGIKAGVHTRALVDRTVDTITSRHVPYSLLDLVRIGLRLLPRRLIDTRPWGGDSDSDKVCSLLPLWFYVLCKARPPQIPPLAAPAEVAEAMPVVMEIVG